MFVDNVRHPMLNPESFVMRWGHSACRLSKSVQLLCISQVGSQQMLLANAMFVPPCLS